MDEAPVPERFLVRRLRVVIVVLALLTIGLLVWNALRGSDEDSGESSEGPQIVSVAELGDLASASEAPVYWAGPQPGAELEYSEAAGSRTYVRYLTGGAEAGDPRAVFLTVSTYPVPDAEAALRANAKRTTSDLRKAEGGALVWVDPSRPTSVYLAEPGSGSQVEVFDPSPRRALDVALSGDVEPAG